MSPGDVIARGVASYVLVAVVGQTAAVVPVVSGYHRAIRGDVSIDPLNSGVAFRHPAARCRARARMVLGAEKIAGRVSPAELAAIHTAIRRVAESEMVEARYAGMAEIAAVV